MADKVSQEQADYRDHRKGQAMCNRCTMFRLVNKCITVEGIISPFGWCKFFKLKEKRK